VPNNRKEVLLTSLREILSQKIIEDMKNNLGQIDFIDIEEENIKYVKDLIKLANKFLIIVTKVNNPELLQILSKIAFEHKLVKFLYFSQIDLAIFGSIIENMKSLGNIDIINIHFLSPLFYINRDNEEIILGKDKLSFIMLRNNSIITKINKEIDKVINLEKNFNILLEEAFPKVVETNQIIYRRTLKKPFQITPEKVGSLLIKQKILPNYLSYEKADHDVEFDNYIEESRQDLRFHYVQKISESENAYQIMIKRIVAIISKTEDNSFEFRIYRIGKNQPITDSSEKDKIAFSYFLAFRDQYEKALDILLKLVQNNTKNPEIFLALGFTYNCMEKFKEALKCNKKAAELNPNNGSIWNSLGFTYLNLEMYQDAINSFNRAVNIDNEDFNSLNYLGYTYYKLGDVDEAIKIINKSLLINPKHSDAFLNLFEIKLDLDEIEEALNYYEKYFDLEIETRDFERAEGLLQKLLNKDKENVNAMIYLGLNCFEKGEYQKAIEYYKKSLSIEPDDAIIWDKIGLAYEYNQDFINAKMAYKKANELKSNNEEILLHLHQIERKELQMKYKCVEVINRLDREWKEVFSMEDFRCCLLNGDLVQVCQGNNIHEFWMDPSNKIRINSSNFKWLSVIPKDLTLDQISEILFQLYKDKVYSIFPINSEVEFGNVESTSELELIEGIGWKTGQRLNNAGIYTIKDLLACSIEDLIKIEGIGIKSAELFLQKGKEVKERNKEEISKLRELIKEMERNERLN